MLKRLISFIVVCSAIFSINLKAQSLDETLSKLSSTVGAAYVKPVISAFGSNLNSGWVSQFPSATILGFHFDLKIVAMGSFYPDELKKFTETGKFYFDNNQIDAILRGSGYSSGTPQYNALMSAMQNQEFNVTFAGPTIIGDKNDYLKVFFPAQSITASGQTYSVSSKQIDITQVKGLDPGTGFIADLWAKIFPTAAAQVTIGTVYGTNVAIRYCPTIKIADIGDLNFWGIGAIHNIGVWFPNPIPLDLSVGFFTQKLKVGKIFESNATQFGIYASKTVGFIVSITPYIGLTLESSKTSVSYDYTSNQTLNGVPVKAHLNIDLYGENSTSAIIGFNLHLAVVNINADYKLAKTKTASIGLSFGL